MITAYLHAHRDVLFTIIGVLCLTAAVLISIGVRLSRPHTGHHQAPPRKDPVWDDDEPADTWAGDIAADIRAEECGDPDCSQMTHTGNMPRLQPLPESEPDGAWTWQPLRTVETVSLPPWEVEEAKARWRAAVERHDEIVVLEDLPGPEAAAVRPDDQGDHRAGKPRNTWTGLLGRPDPQNLPAVATPSPAAHGPDKSAGPSDGGEPVLEGVVVTAPFADYDPDQWLQDRLAELRAASDTQHQQLAVWGHELEAAAA